MRLILLLDYRGALRQRTDVFESLDVDALERALGERGIEVRRVSMEDVANGRVELHGERIHATGSQQPGYREFVDDVLHHLSHDNEMIPRYEIYRAHENKGYQELEKRRLGLAGLEASTFGNLRGAQDSPIAPDYPLVFKPTRGFMSRGVQKVGSPAELERIVRLANRPPGYAVRRIKQWLKQHVFRSRYHAEMYEDCPFAGGFVLQEFVPGAEGDWKVLTFGDRVYAVRRGLRDNDFRASGSGRLDYAIPTDDVLDFARDVHRRLAVPMSSLDVIEVGGQCHLGEFQGVHFGTWTQENAPHHFVAAGTTWKREEGRARLEDDWAHALASALRR